MPYKSVNELPANVRDTLPAAAQEIYLSVFNDVFGPDCDDACASKQAWAAANRSLENIVELHSIGNAISGSHDVVFQRLDSLIKNNGRMILYSAESFQNVHQWVGIPVVLAETTCDILAHPKGNDVMAGNLPDNMRTVGRITAANISSGEPVLRGKIEIDDPAIDAMVSAGEMSLSTGFSASIGNVNGQDRIIGNVVPNHVLIFKRGACRNCYPNDNSARFENIQEGVSMDEESKGLLTSIKEAIENLKPAEHVQDEIKENTMDVKDSEEFKNLSSDYEKVKSELEEMKNAVEQQKKDAAWTGIKNNLPEGWLGDKEADTRAEFENNAPAFALKLIKFNAENVGAAKSAEGSETGGKVVDMENAAEAEVKKFEQEYGLHFVE